PQRGHRRRPPAPPRLRDHGADDRQVVLRDGHRPGPRRLRGDDAGGPRQRVPRLDLRRARQGQQGGRRLLREHRDLPLVREERPRGDLPMSIRWAYAINQWKPQFDDFVRREQHERALKTMSIAGFEGVELTYGTGPGDVEPLDDDAFGRLAACWEAVGRATAEHGIRLALHVDFLSALRRDHVPALLDRTDPALVGLAVDTGELTAGGIAPGA